MTSSLILGAALIVTLLTDPRYALIPGLIGFGLCLTALLNGAFPFLSSWLERLGRSAGLAAWIALTLGLALVGFSSTAVIVIVLFIGGFAAANVFWRLLNRALSIRTKPLVHVSSAEDIPHPNVVLAGVVSIVFLAVIASFIIGYYSIHERGPLGMALLFANAGLAVGVVPTVYRVLQRQGKLGTSQEYPVGPRHLLRDLLFTLVVVGLIGYLFSLATNGQTFLAIPVVAIGIVIVGYAIILARGFLSLRDRLRPYKPLLVSALGMLLLFAPLIVLLSNPPATVTRLYGGAQAAGFLVAVVYIGMTDPWREEARLLWSRLRSAAQRRVGSWMPEVSVKRTLPSSEAEVEKKRWLFSRRTRQTKGSEEGGD